MSPCQIIPPQTHIWPWWSALALGAAQQPFCLLTVLSSLFGSLSLPSVRKLTSLLLPLCIRTDVSQSAHCTQALWGSAWVESRGSVPTDPDLTRMPSSASLGRAWAEKPTGTWLIKGLWRWEGMRSVSRGCSRSRGMIYKCQQGSSGTAGRSLRSKTERSQVGTPLVLAISTRTLILFHSQSREAHLRPCFSQLGALFDFCLQAVFSSQPPNQSFN